MLLFTSNIGVAKTILHECIHAFLGIKSLNENLGMTLPGLNNTDVGELIDQYVANYPELQADHNFMYNHMIPTMVQCLAEIRDLLATPENITSIEDTFIGTPLGTVPETYSLESFNWVDFYKYLAFSGLSHSNCFEEDLPTGSPENYIFQQYNNINRTYFANTCIN